MPSNLLVLDEPTNDLDLETLDLLQEMVADYQGTVIVVSHDRDFLDRVATSVLISDGDGRWTEYAGGYSDMMTQRGAGVSARRTQKTAAASKKAETASEQSRTQQKNQKKLSFKQQHALKTLPGTIEALQAEIAAAEKNLADPDLFTRDPKGFAALTERLEAAQVELTAAEDEWLTLEMLREELGG